MMFSRYNQTKMIDMALTGDGLRRLEVSLHGSNSTLYAYNPPLEHTLSTALSTRHMHSTALSTTCTLYSPSGCSPYSSLSTTHTLYCLSTHHIHSVVSSSSRWCLRAVCADVESFIPSKHRVAFSSGPAVYMRFKSDVNMLNVIRVSPPDQLPCEHTY